MKWINVNDKLPKNNQQVWVTFEWANVWTAQGYAIWEDEDGWFIEIENLDLLSSKKALELGYEVAEITHWMPLPKPPKK